MGQKTLLIFSLVSILFFSCKKPPISCMEISETTASTGTAILFTSCSEKALSYEWFISGPADAPENLQGWSDESFSHAFTVTGTYTVTLNAYEDFSFTGRISTSEQQFLIH